MEGSLPWSNAHEAEDTSLGILGVFGPGCDDILQSAENVFNKQGLLVTLKTNTLGVS